MALLNPMEYHASTSPLIQMLEKGHHGVKLAELSRQSRERLYGWIDLNVPRAGSWNPPPFHERDQRKRRCELAEALAGNGDDPEGEFAAAAEAFRNRTPAPFRAPPEEPVQPDGLAAAGFPFPASEARRMQRANGAKAPLVLDLGDGVTMTLARIPPGEFVIGSLQGAADERPRSEVRVSEAFWMAVTDRK
ncbi:MAG: hypothetical protein PHO07_19625, partial [Pirellulales bacterium]|nr:hypothetical protein [Pirellulales bacterium]